jgi:hypothetical protein
LIFDIGNKLKQVLSNRSEAGSTVLPLDFVEMFGHPPFEMNETRQRTSSVPPNHECGRHDTRAQQQKRQGFLKVLTEHSNESDRASGQGIRDDVDAHVQRRISH